MTLLRQSGVTLAIISGRNARCVESKIQALGVAHLYQGIGNNRRGLPAVGRHRLTFGGVVRLVSATM